MSLLSRARAARLLSRGQQEHAAGELNAARESLEKAAALAPGDHGPPIHLALLAVAEGNPAAGLETLEAARERFPAADEPVYGLFRGQLLLAAGRPEEAAATLTEAAAMDPENRLIAAYRELARIEAGELLAPLEALEQAMPENFAFQGALCRTLERRLFLDGEPDEPPVEETREGEEQAEPEPPPAPYDAPPATDALHRFTGRWFKWRANAAGRAENHERAAELFRVAAERRPDDLEIAAFYAESLYHTGDHDGCRRLLLWRMAELERRGEKDVEFAVPVMGYIGRTYYHRRALGHARAWFERAAALEKEEDAAGNAGLPWPDNLYFLAMLEQHAGKEDTARAMLREMERVEPGLYHQRLCRLIKHARAREEETA